MFINIQYHDIFGGYYTRALSSVVVNQERFVNVDELGLNVLSCDGRALRFASVVDQQQRLKIGDIIYGKSVDVCCSSSSAAAAAAVADDSTELSLSFCAKTVVKLSDADSSTLAKLVDVDVLSILDRLHVQFQHTPGNRSVDEAQREARRRGMLLDASASLRFEAFNWNFDSKHKQAGTPANRHSDRQAVRHRSAVHAVLCSVRSWRRFRTVDHATMVGCAKNQFFQTDLHWHCSHGRRYGIQKSDI